MQGRLSEAFFMVFRVDSEGTEYSKYDRSRQVLSKELHPYSRKHLVPKFGFDTAENGIPTCRERVLKNLPGGNWTVRQSYFGQA